MANDNPRVTNLIKTKTFTASIPRERFEECIQLFRRIPKSRQVLTKDDDHIWEQSLRFSDQLQLIETLMGVSRLTRGLISTAAATTRHMRLEGADYPRHRIVVGALHSSQLRGSSTGTGWRAYSSARLVVASHDYLLLLHSQRQGFETWSFIFEDTGVETVLWRSDAW